jgi:glycosyltransferase involved in cell wall biosynthesis
MVEAMARALPCLGSAVGGIPELLPPSAVVPRDAAQLAERIAAIARDPALRADMSRRNLERARGFHERALQPVREAFFRDVAACTAHAGGALPVPAARGGAAAPAPDRARAS